MHAARPDCSKREEINISTCLEEEREDRELKKLIIMDDDQKR